MAAAAEPRTETKRRRARVKRLTAAAAASPNGRNYTRNYDDELLECRYPNHHWVKSEVRHAVFQGERIVHVVFDCRCTAVRTDYLYRDGSRAYASTIHYPEGYVIKGQGRTNRADWRREVVRRALS